MGLYTVEQVIDKVRILIEEAAEGGNVITENQLIMLVNDSQKWVAGESGSFTEWGTITLEKNKVRYDVPAGASVILGLEYNYETDDPGYGIRMLRQIDPNQDVHAPKDNVPLFWYYRGNQISVYPSMPVEPGDTTMNVLFSKLPAALTALGDSLTIPDEYQIVVPYRVAEQVAIKDNQLEKWQILSAKVKELTAEGISQYASGAFTGTPVGPPAGGAG